jgi:hypothetical protein
MLSRTNVSIVTTLVWVGVKILLHQTMELYKLSSITIIGTAVQTLYSLEHSKLIQLKKGTIVFSQTKYIC